MKSIMPNKEKFSGYHNTPEHREFLERVEQARNKYEQETEDFWRSLTYEDKLKVFFYITSKIYESDVKYRGSYRFFLYDIMNFGTDSYELGMDSNYLELHNLIQDGIEFNNIKNAKEIRIKDGNHTFKFDDEFDFSYDEKENILILEKKMPWWEKED